MCDGEGDLGEINRKFAPSARRTHKLRTNEREHLTYDGSLDVCFNNFNMSVQ